MSHLYTLYCYLHITFGNIKSPILGTNCYGIRSRVINYKYKDYGLLTTPAAVTVTTDFILVFDTNRNQTWFVHCNMS